jgi:hypothetical protein
MNFIRGPLVFSAISYTENEWTPMLECLRRARDQKKKHGNLHDPITPSWIRQSVERRLYLLYRPGKCTVNLRAEAVAE